MQNVANHFLMGPKPLVASYKPPPHPTTFCLGRQIYFEICFWMQIASAELWLKLEKDVENLAEATESRCTSNHTFYTALYVAKLSLK